MYKEQTDEKKCKNEADTLKVAEMRRCSLETFSESNARLGNEPGLKKPRNTGSETVQYLPEKSENKLKLSWFKRPKIMSMPLSCLLSSIG